MVVVACSEVNAEFFSSPRIWFEDGDVSPNGVSCQAHPSLMVNTSVDLLEVQTAFMGGIRPSPCIQMSAGPLLNMNPLCFHIFGCLFSIGYVEVGHELIDCGI